MNPHLEFLIGPVYSGSLAPAHRLDLQKSGVTEETITRQKIRSAPPGMIDRLLQFNTPKVTSAYLIPFPDPHDGWMNHVRLKIFPPLVDKKGHTVKYLQPKRTSPRVYFARSVIERVLRSDDRLFIVEGEKKTLAVAQLGIAAVGISGIEAWHLKGSRALLADFDALPLARREVTIVPDGDVQTNVDVERAVSRLARALDARGAHVRIAVLPLRVPHEAPA